MKKFLLGFFFLVTLVGIVIIPVVSEKIEAAGGASINYLGGVPSGPVTIYTGTSNSVAYCIGYEIVNSSTSLLASFTTPTFQNPQTTSITSDGVTVTVSPRSQNCIGGIPANRQYYFDIGVSATNNAILNPFKVMGNLGIYPSFPIGATTPSITGFTFSFNVVRSTLSATPTSTTIEPGEYFDVDVLYNGTSVVGQAGVTISNSLYLENPTIVNGKYRFIPKEISIGNGTITFSYNTLSTAVNFSMNCGSSISTACWSLSPESTSIEIGSQGYFTVDSKDRQALINSVIISGPKSFNSGSLSGASTISNSYFTVSTSGYHRNPQVTITPLASAPLGNYSLSVNAYSLDGGTNDPYKQPDYSASFSVTQTVPTRPPPVARWTSFGGRDITVSSGEEVLLEWESEYADQCKRNGSVVGLEGEYGFTAEFTGNFGIVCEQTDTGKKDEDIMIVYVTTLPMSGTLTSETPSCSIPLNGSSCPITLTWSIENPVGETTAVTAVGMDDIDVIANSLVSQSGTQSVTVPYNSRTFYLYNNGDSLAQITGTASCAPGTSWNETKCASSVATGTITASNCSIPLNGSSCSSNLTWGVINPISGANTAVTKDKPTANTQVSTALSGPGTSTISHGTTNFYLYHNGVMLNSDPAVATCQSGTWDGARCSSVTPPSSATGIGNFVGIILCYRYSTATRSCFVFLFDDKNQHLQEKSLKA